MLDTHIIPDPNWGIRPILFSFNGVDIPSYATFMLLGLLVGLGFYYLTAKKDNVYNKNSSIILQAGIFSGIIGAKIPEWVVNFNTIVDNLPDVGPLLTGRTILGGLFGGSIGVLITKRILGIHDRRGNQFAPAIALGIAIGRIGCLLAGCCYGIPTSLPWGLDFGDGILRHPTQLYESFFCLGLFFYLLTVKSRLIQPGKLFQRFMTIYLSFRFIIEFIRVEPIVMWGFTGFQFACLAGIIYVHRDTWFEPLCKKLWNSSCDRQKNARC
jgi:phosphatidylglycerol:prolipoprotein diacylglycerol transferase